MTVLPLDHSIDPALLAAGALATGFLAGKFHYTALWWSVRRLMGDWAADRTVLAITLARLAPLPLALVLIAQTGALPLVAALAGVLVSRRTTHCRIEAPS
jgi:F1F0 ATPase subunit 2